MGFLTSFLFFKKANKKTRIAIVGGGASGAIALLQALQKLSNFGVELEIFEPSENLGSGLAYGNSNESLLLNVPAERMGFDPQRPDEFDKWLRQKTDVLGIKSYPFVPRYLFLRYLNDCLANFPEKNWMHRRQRVSRFSYRKKRWTVGESEGFNKEFDYLFIAAGYDRKLNLGPLNLAGDYDSERIISAEGATTFDLLGKKHILIIGSGLTAFDVWRCLRARGFDGQVTMVSRHGQVPLAHEAPQTHRKLARPGKRFLPILRGLSPLAVFRLLRSLKNNTDKSWAEIADQIRPQVTDLWSIWSHQEREQFLRHLKVRWETIRHRLPPSVAEEWKADENAGKARIIKGRIESTHQGPQSITVKFNSIHELQLDLIVIAAGVQTTRAPLQFHMPVKGVEPCPHGFGYINLGAPRLWFIGPLSKGSFWEVTSIPDIRMQVAHILDQISAEIQGKKGLPPTQMEVHPRVAGESYLGHLRTSLGFALIALTQFYRSVIHAFLPICFQNRVSNDMRDLSSALNKRRRTSFKS